MCRTFQGFPNVQHGMTQDNHMNNPCSETRYISKTGLKEHQKLLPALNKSKLLGNAKHVLISPYWKRSAVAWITEGWESQSQNTLLCMPVQLYKTYTVIIVGQRNRADQIQCSMAGMTPGQKEQRSKPDATIQINSVYFESEGYASGEKRTFSLR